MLITCTYSTYKIVTIQTSLIQPTAYMSMFFKVIVQPTDIIFANTSRNGIPFYVPDLTDLIKKIN